MVREIWKRGFTAGRLKYWTPALALSVAAVALAPYAAEAVRSRSRSVAPVRHLPYPQLDWPLEITNSQYLPLAWNDVPGWNDDDQLAAYRTFRASCKPIAAKPDGAAEDKALGDSLRDPCRDARASDLADNAAAKAFFERHFEPLKISKLGDADGFVTGYYEPVIEGSRTQNEVYNVPVYRRPSNLFVRGFKQDAANLPNKGAVYRKIGRRKLVPYYDRAEIEDGAIEGRGLEIAWLRNQTDLLFAQIQGSARISLDDGSTVRINYDAYNGLPYTPVGRILIERGIIPREQMSMQRIRDWMEQNPEGANELRRMNRSYIFFREVQLSDKDEAVGAQGIPLTPGRSIAVDKSLHVYGTPFFITGELPIESEKSKSAFHRLMIAQDTGSAIVGPARADLYFGAGQEAGKVSGRLKHNIQFVMLVPKSLDPVARGRKMPLPDARPSEKIAKLFPQVPPKDPVKDAVKEQAKDQSTQQDQAKTAAASSAKDEKAPASAATTVAQNVVAAQTVPLPEARPRIESDRNIRRLRYGRRHRHRR
ncbi:MltA domain-containing protein [Bradyrhizobium ontarionense]|uniref:peptidoglycan lytic exotransglycosylase n=1 Tax=Bradyrhizobium ontarionense TaxID=2898149 RepID=A0ABY3R554_9BRAD|nr:MltA domain-containing protein [Bradyrhizobium sp. A19]UFZ02192.1 MltA domain-containing protein [Bradyrhizobium sp. A19]